MTLQTFTKKIVLLPACKYCNITLFLSIPLKFTSIFALTQIVNNILRSVSNISEVNIGHNFEINDNEISYVSDSLAKHKSQQFVIGKKFL